MDSCGVGFTKKLGEAASEAIEKYRMTDGVSSVMVALSGGSDSCALLHFMRSYCRGRGIELSAAHVNHLIRGEEAYRDAKFCAQLCASLDIRLFQCEIDVPAAAEKDGVSLEEAARSARYAYFERLREEHGIQRVATAHNSLDNLETAVFHMLRGSGARGLCGIPPVRGDIIRPLIFCGKDTILGYCAENSLRYVTDSTNCDTGYTRNYIRHELYPLMSKVNPAVCTAVSRMCELMRRDADFLDGEARKIPASTTLAALKKLDGALLSRFVALRYSEAASDPERTLEAVHIEAALALIRDGSAGQSLSLPGRITLTLTENGISFSARREEIPRTVPYRYEIIGGLNIIKEADAAVYVYNNDCGTNSPAEIEKDIKELKNIYKLFIHVTVRSDKISGRIYARGRLPGDRFYFKRMNRSVKKLMCDLGVARGEREVLPLLCDGVGILWIPGIGVRDGVSAYAANFSAPASDPARPDCSGIGCPGGTEADAGEHIIHFFYFKEKNDR